MIRDEGGSLEPEGQVGAILYLSYCLGKDDGVNLACVRGTREEGTDNIEGSLNWGMNGKGESR